MQLVEIVITENHGATLEAPVELQIELQKYFIHLDRIITLNKLNS